MYCFHFISSPHNLMLINLSSRLFELTDWHHLLSMPGFVLYRNSQPLPVNLRGLGFGCRRTRAFCYLTGSCPGCPIADHVSHFYRNCHHLGRLGSYYLGFPFVERVLPAAHFLTLSSVSQLTLTCFVPPALTSGGLLLRVASPRSSPCVFSC